MIFLLKAITKSRN